VYDSLDGYQYLCYENDTISNALRDYGEWDNGLIQHAEMFLREDSVILDIGANIGTWTIPLAIKNRKIFSFEPMESSFYALCGNIFLNQKEKHIVVHRCALTDNVEQALTMTTAETINMGGSRLSPTQNGQSCTLATLDSLTLPPIDFIKLDVEGHEINVLRGGIQTILRDQPIIFFECWDVHSEHWKGIPNTAHELMAFIRSLGYTIQSLGCGDNYKASPLSRA
jgi:FkbM family methyltransferase